MNGAEEYDSDESGDEDYIPSREEPFPSEEDSDSDVEEEDEESEVQRKGKRKKKTSKSGKKSCLRQSECDNMHGNEIEEEHKKENVVTVTDEKEKADSLWSDFKKETNCQKLTSDMTTSQKSKDLNSRITVEEVYDFAGEEIRVMKEVPTNSIKEIVQMTKKKLGSKDVPSGSAKGISTVLGNLGKKNKIGTLEKSKLDWDHFKKFSGLSEEIKTHNKGKNGYLDKLDFLQRADQRQYQIEKSLRCIKKIK